MRIGDLRHLVYLQTPTASRTERGAEQITWTDSPALRAKIRTTSGDERSANDQTVPVAAHEATLRWPLPRGTAISTKSRLKWLDDGTARYFSILAILEPDNRGRVIVLTCQELIGETRGL
jgi:head-tail adaptor